MLNNKRYPEFDYNLSFPANQFSRAYGDAAEFRTKFFNMNEWYQIQTLPPQIIKPFILYFCPTFPNKVKN